MGAAVALMYWLKRAIWALIGFGCCGCLCFFLLSACWSLWVVALTLLVALALESLILESWASALLSSALLPPLMQPEHG